MSVKIEAFLALEASLSSRISRAWGKVAETTLPLIYAKLQQQDILGATRLVDDLDLSPVIRECRDYVRYVSLASILFGASRFGSEVADTKIMEKGTQYLNPLIARVTNTYADALVNLVGDQVQSSLYEVIAEYDLSNPATNFAPSAGSDVIFKAEAVHELLRPYTEFRTPIMDVAQRMVQMISSLHTSRLAAFGYTEEAMLLGYTQYAITEQLDNKICPVCEIMHGKVFEVSDARSLLERVVLTDDAQSLKVLQPWPKQNKMALQELRGMSNAELVNRGWHIPPYHPWCRGQLVPIDQVPRIEDTASYQAAFPTEAMGDFAPIESTEESFKSLGVDITPEQLEIWNREVGQPPENLFQSLTGQTAEDLSNIAYDPVQDTYDSSRYGMTVALSMGEEERLKARMQMAGEYYGIKGVQAKLEYTIEEARAVMRLSEFGVEEAEEKDIPVLMGAWVGSALLLGMDMVELDSTDDPSGRHWADYGALPSFDEWMRVRQEVRGALPELGLAAVDQEAVLAAIDDDDQQKFWELVGLGLPEVNKFLGTINLKVNLFLDDIATMERFSAATNLD